MGELPNLSPPWAECLADECPFGPIIQQMQEDRVGIGDIPLVVLVGLRMVQWGLRNHPDMAGSTKRMCGWLRKGILDNYPGVGPYPREEVLHRLAECVAMGCADQPMPPAAETV